MKKLVSFVLFACLVWLCLILGVVSVTASTCKSVVATSLKNNRFETIETGSATCFVLLLDKHTGSVCKYEKLGQKMVWSEIQREMTYIDEHITYTVDAVVKTNYNRFQVKFVDDEIFQCFLVDTEYGHTWELVHDKDKGWRFVFNYLDFE